MVGAALERFVQMTNWEFFESVQRFSFVMKKVRTRISACACSVPVTCRCVGSEGSNAVHTADSARITAQVGVWEALRKAGVKEGDPVVIGTMEMAWENEDDEGLLYDNWRRSGISGPARGARHWPSGG